MDTELKMVISIEIKDIVKWKIITKCLMMNITFEFFRFLIRFYLNSSNYIIHGVTLHEM